MNEAPSTLSTIIHSYSFNTGKPDEAAAWRKLCAELTGAGLKCFNVLAGECAGTREADIVRRQRAAIEAHDGKPVTLETKFLFDNQWNSVEYGRVFDWYEGIQPNRRIKSGHWLEQTEEMRARRRDTLKCGYCGRQHSAAAGLVFCPDCLDSEYLKPEDLRLTRLRPVDQTGFEYGFAPLSDAERAELLPRYHAAQGIGKTRRDEGRMSAARARIIRERDEAPAKAAAAIKDAQINAAGLLWLLDNGFDAGNAIYYTHTRRFCLGWRAPLQSVPDCMTEFPYPYDLKMADGRKLSADRG